MFRDSNKIKTVYLQIQITMLFSKPYAWLAQEIEQDEKKKTHEKNPELKAPNMLTI